MLVVQTKLDRPARHAFLLKYASAAHDSLHCGLCPESGAAGATAARRYNEVGMVGISYRGQNPLSAAILRPLRRRH